MGINTNNNRELIKNIDKARAIGSCETMLKNVFVIGRFKFYIGMEFEEVVDQILYYNRMMEQDSSRKKHRLTLLEVNTSSTKKDGRYKLIEFYSGFEMADLTFVNHNILLNLQISYKSYYQIFKDGLSIGYKNEPRFLNDSENRIAKIAINNVDYTICNNIFTNETPTRIENPIVWGQKIDRNNTNSKFLQYSILKESDELVKACEKQKIGLYSIIVENISWFKFDNTTIEELEQNKRKCYSLILGINQEIANSRFR